MISWLGNGIFVFYREWKFMHLTLYAIHSHKHTQETRPHNQVSFSDIFMSHTHAHTYVHTHTQYIHAHTRTHTYMRARIHSDGQLVTYYYVCPRIRRHYFYFYDTLVTGDVTNVPWFVVCCCIFFYFDM